MQTLLCCEARCSFWLIFIKCMGSYLFVCKSNSYSYYSIHLWKNLNVHNPILSVTTIHYNTKIGCKWCILFLALHKCIWHCTYILQSNKTVHAHACIVYIWNRWHWRLQIHINHFTFLTDLIYKESCIYNNLNTYRYHDHVNRSLDLKSPATFFVSLTNVFYAIFSFCPHFLCHN